MTDRETSAARCAVLIGSYTSGKTTLVEALLHNAGAIHRKGSITQGNTVGDPSPEARQRQMSVEPNIAHCTYLDDHWSIVDCPGSIELAHERNNGLMAADVAVIVAEPELSKSLILAPIFKFLDDHKIPHILFVNKMDKAAVRVAELMEALQVVSSKPLVLRQVPIREGEDITGFVESRLNALEQEAVASSRRKNVLAAAILSSSAGAIAYLFNAYGSTLIGYLKQLIP